MLLIGEDWSGGAEGRDAGQHHARARGEVRRHPRIRCQGQRVLSRARGVLVSYLVINFSRAWCFMSASTMREHEEKYAVILACDVKIRQAV